MRPVLICRAIGKRLHMLCSTVFRCALGQSLYILRAYNDRPCINEYACTLCRLRRIDPVQ